MDKLLLVLFEYSLAHPRRPGQGPSVCSGEKAGRKCSSSGERAPGYRLSPDHFQKFKRMLAPDWAQKMLCIIIPNWRTVFPEFVHDSYCLASLARFVHQACAYKGNFYFLLSQPETKELPMSRKNVWDAISRSN